MSWNDKLSYQENVDIFLESLKDFSKTEDNEYKLAKQLVNPKHLSTQKVFAKLYLDVFKRLKNDFLKVKFVNTKELIEIKHKDDIVFSYKPPRYISIPNVLNKLSKEINQKEENIRDMRDGIIAGNATQKMLNDIEKLKVTVLTLYEKQNVLREVHEILNKRQDKQETVERLKKQDQERKTRIVELKKQMKESFTSRDIHKFQMAAKEIAELNNKYLNGIDKEFKELHSDDKDFLLIRSPEIIVNNKDIGKKKPKKTAKNKVKTKKTNDERKTEKDKETKETKDTQKPKKTKKKEQKGSGEDITEYNINDTEQMKGGFNLLDNLHNQIGGTKPDEFEIPELSLDIIGINGDEQIQEQIGVKEQFGAGNEDKTSNPVSSVDTESFHTTPPFSPGNNDVNMPPPNNQMGGNTSPDVKVVSVSQNAMGGMTQQSQEQTAGADPFANPVNLEPDLNPVMIDQFGGYEDMTDSINNYPEENSTYQNMNGGSYGGSSSPGVFDTTYQDQSVGNMNSNPTDPFGLGQMPENINLSVTKLP